MGRAARRRACAGGAADPQHRRPAARGQAAHPLVLMVESAAAPEWLRVAGIIAAAALAAGAVLAPSSRARAWAMLGALALTPGLLALEIWNAPQLVSLRERPVTQLAVA